MSYNVFFYNGIENAAANLAQTIWQSAELATHFVLLPYMSYKVMNWAFHSPQVQAPTQPQGFFSSLKGYATHLISSTASMAGKFVGAEVISHTINQWWLNKAFWEGIKPIPVAFMRPILERLVLSYKNPYDANNINFSLREMIPGGEGSWLSHTVNPLLKIKSGVSSLFHTTTTAEMLAPKAYELGDSVAKTTEAVINTLQDILGGTEKIGQCLASPVDATKCYEATRNYLTARTDVIYAASTPLRAFFAQWAEWGWQNMSYYGDTLVKEGLKEGFKNGSEHVMNATNAVLWNVATTVEANTKIPAQVIYAAELTALGILTVAGTYKFARFSKNLATDATRSFCLSFAGALGATFAWNRNKNAVVVQQPPAAPAANKPLTVEEIDAIIARLRATAV